MNNKDSIYKAAILLERKIKLDKLFLKNCKKGNLNIIKKMITRLDININVVDKDKCTSLIQACRKGHINIVEYLLEQKNINIKKRDKNGFSALDCAIWVNKKEIVDLLLKTKRLDINERIPYGIFKNETALSISILRGNKKTLFF